MVIDNREGDLQHDYYRPAAMQRLRAGLDADGRIVAWDHVIASCSRNAYRKDPRGEHSTETYGSYVGPGANRPAAGCRPATHARFPMRGCATAHR